MSNKIIWLWIVVVVAQPILAMNIDSDDESVTTNESAAACITVTPEQQQILKEGSEILKQRDTELYNAEYPRKYWNRPQTRGRHAWHYLTRNDKRIRASNAKLRLQQLEDQEEIEKNKLVTVIGDLIQHTSGITPNDMATRSGIKEKTFEKTQKDVKFGIRLYQELIKVQRENEKNIASGSCKRPHDDSNTPPAKKRRQE